MSSGQDEARKYSPRLLYLWVACEVVGGQIGIPILIATLVFSDLRRLPTLFSLLVTWVCASIIACLLFYAGKGLPNDPQPTFGLCLAQASLMYGVPHMTALSAFALVYEGWLTVTGKNTPPGTGKLGARTRLLLALPWGGLLLAAILSLIVGITSPQAVSRDRRFFYCSIQANGLTNTLAVIVGLILIVTIVYAAQIALVLRHTWLDVKNPVADDALDAPKTSSYMVIRITIFGLYLCVTLVLCFVSIVAPTSALLDLVAGSIPAAVFIIFATQADIVRIWVNLLPAVIKPRMVREWANLVDPPISVVAPLRTSIPAPETPFRPLAGMAKHFAPGPHRPNIDCGGDEKCQNLGLAIRRVVSMGSFVPFDKEAQAHLAEKPLPLLPHDWSS